MGARTKNGDTPPLPASIEAERSVLGAILLDNAAFQAAAEQLKPTDFFLGQHKKIFEHMEQMADFGEPIDLVTLSELLDRRGELEAAGGPSYLTQLMDGLPRATNVAHYARIVREKSQLRQVIRFANGIQERAFAGEVDSAAIAQLSEIKDGDSNFSRKIFHTTEDVKTSAPIRMAINQILQLEGATIIGGLSGHGKTLVMLSIVKALLSGKPLFGHFEVRERAARVIYLIPESTLGPFAHRLRLFTLLPFVENDQLLTRTLSLGPTPSLSDPRILAAAKGSDIFLDTAIRFMAQGDENNASDNQRGLAQDIFALLRAGARSVVAAHHASKGFAKGTAITLENSLRGTTDFGAMVMNAFALRQTDPIQNIVHVECVKSRDIDPVQPFEIIGRSYINQHGDFQMLKRPGECEKLSEQPELNRTGASTESRQTRAANLALLREWLSENPQQTSEELSQRFKAAGINIQPGTVRRYKSEIL